MSRFHPANRHGKVIVAAVAIIRVLIGSYFLAAAAAMIFRMSDGTAVDGITLDSQVALAVALYLAATAILIMLGRAPRLTVLMLALYVLGAGLAQIFLGSPWAAGIALARDALLAALVVLVSLAEQRGIDPFGRLGKYLHDRPDAARQAMPRVRNSLDAAARITRPRDVSTHDAFLAAITRLAEDEPPETLDAFDRNLFGDLWDAQPEPSP